MMGVQDTASSDSDLDFGDEIADEFGEANAELSSEEEVQKEGRKGATFTQTLSSVKQLGIVEFRKSAFTKMEEVGLSPFLQLTA